MGRLEYCPLVGSGGCNKPENVITYKKDTFFLAEPFQPEKERKKREMAIRSAIKEILKESYTESALKFADKEPTESAVFCDICQKIQSAEYGIVELSGLNANVLLEFGMMLSHGRPVFVLVKKELEESIRSKLPSDIVWKRAITYDETFDIMTGLITQLENRSHLKTRPFVGEIDLKQPLEENYKSVRKFYCQIGKKSISVKPHELKKNFDRVIFQYCQFMRMNPDQIIENAQHEAMTSAGHVKSHDENFKNFLFSLNSDSKRHNYWGVLRGFYKHNDIRGITIPRNNYARIHNFEKLTTDSLKKICDVATLRGRSWILVDSYIGLDIGRLSLLTVEDFHIDKWGEDKQIYPVTIRAEVSGTFDYTTFIGSDAKKSLKDYLDASNLRSHDIVWKMVHQTFRGEFETARQRAGVGIVNIDESKKDEKPRKIVSITPKSLRQRLIDTLKEEIPWSNKHLIEFMLGRRPEGEKLKVPLDDEVEKAYMQVLPKLIVYNGQIPPIKIRIHPSTPRFLRKQTFE